MKLTETLALINAGYTKAEIAAMESGESIPAPADDPAPQEPAAAPAQPATPAPAVDNEELLTAIKALTAHSIISSSGSRTVMRCSQIPGAEMTVTWEDSCTLRMCLP